MSLTERDVSIITQVAYKAAIENTPAGVDLLDPNEQPAFEGRITYLTDTLVAAIEVAVAKHAKSEAAPARSSSGNHSAAPAPSEDGATVRVIATKEGGQQGPLPAWFVKAAADKGVTEVFDNRQRLVENPKLPWFKSTKEQGEVPFWPPKAR